MKKLDEDSENLKVETVNKKLSQEIVKARTAKGWKQKDLVQKLMYYHQLYKNMKMDKQFLIIM